MRRALADERSAGDEGCFNAGAFGWMCVEEDVADDDDGSDYGGSRDVGER